MSKKSQYRGVTRSERLKKHPWITQVVVSGINYYLGNFPEEVEAAKAYDNAAYWFGLEGFRTGGLNFPEDYAGESTPPPLAQTRKAQAKHRARLATCQTPPGDSRPPEIIALDEAIKSLRTIRERLLTARALPQVVSEKLSTTNNE